MTPGANGAVRTHCGLFVRQRLVFRHVVLPDRHRRPPLRVRPRQTYAIAASGALGHATFGIDRKAPVQLAVVVAVYPIIFLGELPDKTMFASLVMSTRGRPAVVWLGAAAAFAVHVAIAVTVGVALFHLLPARALDGFVAAMFLAGAVLALREAVKERQKEQLVEREVASHRRTAVTAFVVIFIAEWGDLTQILTANLAAHYHDALSVAVGAVLALWTVAALAVVSGQSILRVVNVATVRIVTAVVLAGLTGWAVHEAVR
jgi:Ca2+/H+ antiporter, TMEM165/GDT1 family